MRRIVNNDKIEEVTVSIIEKLEIIQETKKELINDIQKISECYRGSDAELIKTKYNEEVSNLDIFTNTIESYTRYFKWLTSNYGENLNSTKNSFATISNDIKLDKKLVNDDTFSKVLNIKELEFKNGEE